jgi:hypothetical protein
LGRSLVKDWNQNRRTASRDTKISSYTNRDAVMAWEVDKEIRIPTDTGYYGEA